MHIQANATPFLYMEEEDLITEGSHDRYSGGHSRTLSGTSDRLILPCFMFILYRLMLLSFLSLVSSSGAGPNLLSLSTNRKSPVYA